MFELRAAWTRTHFRLIHYPKGLQQDRICSRPRRRERLVLCRLSSSPATGTGTTSLDEFAWACPCAALVMQCVRCTQHDWALQPPRATNGHYPGNFRRKRRSFQIAGAAHTARAADPDVDHNVSLRSVPKMLIPWRRVTAVVARAPAQHVMHHPVCTLLCRKGLINGSILAGRD